MANLPTGTVTFLFTDIEGSTALWENYPMQMRSALARYHEILQSAVEPGRGYVFEMVGDACRAAFATAPEALRAALEAQRDLFAEEWSEPINLRVRMALHTGVVEEHNGYYFGAALEGVGRLLSAAHGGQVLVSGATYGLVSDYLELMDPQASLLELGEYRLGGSGRSERVYQLAVPDLPERFPGREKNGDPSGGERYHIKGLLGGGGMAWVYLAHDKVLGREVAYKRIKQDYASNEEFVERFIREAKSAASLSGHENIVTIHDQDTTEEDSYYITMEYVPGGTLKDLIRTEGSLPAPEALRMALQVAEALQEAHKRGIIHRDIKPQNVLLTDKGNVKVADFGIAKAAASSTLTTGPPPYAPAYASPEQKRGESVGPRSDLYSLGVVLHEMLTGELPLHAGIPPERVMERVGDRETNPEALEELSGIIARLLAEEPEERHPDAQSLIEDLERVSGKLGPVIRRRPRLLALGIIGLTAVVALIIVGLLAWDLPEISPTSNLAGKNEGGGEGAPSASDPGGNSGDRTEQTTQSQNPDERNEGGTAQTIPNPGDVFADDFSDQSGGWLRGEYEYGIAEYTNGSYRLYRPSAAGSGSIQAWPNAGGSLRDTTVEVDAKRIGDAPAKHTSYWGIFCRAQDNYDDYYEISIWDDGYAEIGRWNGNEYNVLVGAYNDAIREGSQTNHIRAECVGSKLTLYVNGEEVLEAEDEEFESGGVGLLVGYESRKPPGVEVLFDNFEVSSVPMGNIFEDDFSDTSRGWGTEEFNDGSSADYTNGGYQLYNPPSAAFDRTELAHAGTLGDAIVEVDAKRTGDVPDGGYSVWGLDCRTSDNFEDGYEMGIGDDGYSYIDKFEDGDFTTLAEGTFSDAIHESSQTNHIRAECVGSKLTLYVNGQKLLEAENAEFESGRVGLAVAGTEVLFDNFEVSSP